MIKCLDFNEITDIGELSLYDISYTICYVPPPAPFLSQYFLLISGDIAGTDEISYALINLMNYSKGFHNKSVFKITLYDQFSYSYLLDNLEKKAKFKNSVRFIKNDEFMNFYGDDWPLISLHLHNLILDTFYEKV